MFTEQALAKVRTDLNTILANFSFSDYVAANYHKNGKRKSKKHIPYSLSGDTQEALRLYSLSQHGPGELTLEQEEKIKAYLLPFRTYRTEFLIDPNETRKNMFASR